MFVITDDFVASDETGMVSKGVGHFGVVGRVDCRVMDWGWVLVCFPCTGGRFVLG